jgi:hypothetical protein
VRTHTTKIALAREQLEDGIALFLAERYVSSLTLLGAAEEILGRIIEAASGAHPLEADWQKANRIRTALGHPHISKAELFRSFNAGRNKVKHHSPGQTLRVTHDRFGVAFMMIQRATSCADYLNLRYKGRTDYRAWFLKLGWGNPWKRRTRPDAAR